MTTYDLRRLALRVKNAQIRSTDIGYQLAKAGYLEEGKTADHVAMLLNQFYVRLIKKADATRDPRGSSHNTGDHV